ASVAHLLYLEGPGYSIRHVARVISRTCLKHQSRFPGHNGSAERRSPSRRVIRSRIGGDYSFSRGGHENCVGAKISKRALGIAVTGGAHADHTVVSGGIDQNLPGIISGCCHKRNVFAQGILDRILQGWRTLLEFKTHADNVCPVICSVVNSLDNVEQLRAAVAGKRLERHDLAPGAIKCTRPAVMVP